MFHLFFIQILHKIFIYFDSSVQLCILDIFFINEWRVDQSLFDWLALMTIDRRSFVNVLFSISSFVHFYFIIRKSQIAKRLLSKNYIFWKSLYQLLLHTATVAIIIISVILFIIIPTMKTSRFFYWVWFYYRHILTLALLTGPTLRCWVEIFDWTRILGRNNFGLCCDHGKNVISLFIQFLYIFCTGIKFSFIWMS